MPRRELAVRQGQIWAYRENAESPLVPAQVINQPTHYEADIVIRLVNSPERGPIVRRRVRIPVRWDRVEGYLVTHADIPREAPAPAEVTPEQEQEALRAAANDLFSIGEETLLRIVREELAHIVGVPRVALKYKDAVKSTGYSETTLRAAVNNVTCDRSTPPAVQGVDADPK